MKYNKSLLTTSSILASALLISTFFPPFQAFDQFNFLIVILFFLWALLAYLIERNVFTNLVKKYNFLLFLVIYTSIIPIFFNNSQIGNRYFIVGIMFLIPIIYEFYKKVDKTVNLKILKYSIYFLIFTLSITYSRLIYSPFLSRSIKQYGIYSYQLKLQGIGGYELVYFILLLQLVLVFKINNFSNIKKLWKVVYFILLILSILVIFSANFLISIILFILSVLLYFTNTKKSYIRKFFIYFFIIMLFLYNQYILSSIINFLISIFNSGSVYLKLITWSNEINSGIIFSSVFNERLFTLIDTFEAFSNNLVFGIIPFEIKYSNNYLTGFGQHSFFTDTFALFGIFISISYTLFYFNILNKLTKYQKNIYKKKIIKISYFIATLLLILNNITLSIAAAIFYYIPVILDSIQIQNENKE